MNSLKINRLLAKASNFENNSTLLRYSNLDSLDQTIIKTKDPAQMINDAFKALETEDWQKNAASIAEFEKKFKLVLKIFEYLGAIPTPVGNPFSLALIGDDIYKKDYVSLFEHLYNGSPMYFLAPAGALPRYATTVIREAGIFKPVVKAALNWVARNISNPKFLNVIAAFLHGAINLTEGFLLEKGQEIASWICDNGFKAAGDINKKIKENVASAQDYAKFITEYLIYFAEQEIKKISQGLLV